MIFVSIHACLDACDVVLSAVPAGPEEHLIYDFPVP